MNKPVFKMKVDALFANVDKYIENVPNEINDEVAKEIPSIQSNTKKMVKGALTKGNGVDVGIYKKSIKLENSSTGKDEIKFVVGATKPHYRLSHLLEHGHKMTPNKHFYRNVPYTRSIPHILPAQDYVDDAVISLYKKALDKALKGK